MLTAFVGSKIVKPAFVYIQNHGGVVKSGLAFAAFADVSLGTNEYGGNNKRVQGLQTSEFDRTNTILEFVVSSTIKARAADGIERSALRSTSVLG